MTATQDQELNASVHTEDNSALAVLDHSPITEPNDSGAGHDTTGDTIDNGLRDILEQMSDQIAAVESERYQASIDQSQAEATFIDDAGNGTPDIDDMLGNPQDYAETPDCAPGATIETSDCEHVDAPAHIDAPADDPYSNLGLDGGNESDPYAEIIEAASEFNNANDIWKDDTAWDQATADALASVCHDGYLEESNVVTEQPAELEVHPEIEAAPEFETEIESGVEGRIEQDRYLDDHQESFQEQGDPVQYSPEESSLFEEPSSDADPSPYETTPHEALPEDVTSVGNQLDVDLAFQHPPVPALRPEDRVEEAADLATLDEPSPGSVETLRPMLDDQRAWLESRFQDVADQIRATLDARQNDNEIFLLSERMNDIEQKLDSVLAHAPQDEAYGILQSHIVDLTAQLDHIAAELSRFGPLEDGIRGIVNHLAAKQSQAATTETRLPATSAQPRPDVPHNIDHDDNGNCDPLDHPRDVERTAQMASPRHRQPQADAPNSTDRTSLNQPRPDAPVAMTQAAPSPRSTKQQPVSRNEMIASARRAAQAAARQAAANPDNKGRCAAPSTAAKPDAIDSDAANPEKKTKRLVSFSKPIPQPLLVIAIISLVCIGLGLFYGKYLRGSPTSAVTSNTVAPSSTTPDSSAKVPATPGTGTAEQSYMLPDGTFTQKRPDAAPISANEMERVSTELGGKVFRGQSATLPQAIVNDVAFQPMSGEAAFQVTEPNSGTAAKTGKIASKTSLPLDLPPARIGPLSLRLAAAKGDSLAQFQVAVRLAQGQGVKRDYVQAAEWYRRAASNGFAPAQYRLAALHERGTGVAKDIQRARIWYQRAAKQGNIRSMHNLAVIHTAATGNGPDYISASQWFGQAANHGLRDSQFNLAVLYQNGLGVNRNTILAYKWFALAAANGDGEARKRLAALKSELSAAAIKSANRLVTNWSALPVDPMVNNPNSAMAKISSRSGAKTKRVTASNPKIAATQKLLRILGYDTGPVDGRMGPRTIKAIRDFQSHAEMPVNGRVSQKLLDRLNGLMG